MESLWQQATALESALEDAANALGKNEGLCRLVRRTTDLEAAMASYETAFHRHEQLADANASAAARRARRILEDSWEVAMDKLEALTKVQDESGAKVELAEFGDIEHLVEEVELVEFGIKEVEEPRIDKLVVEESANKVELEFFAAEVEVERFDVSEVEDEIRTAEVQAEWMAIKPLEDPGEQAVKSVEEMQVDIEVKQKLGGVFRGKFEVEETRINKDGLEFRATEEELEFRAIRNKLQELRILESNHEDEFGDEFELQVPEFGVLRFLGWVSRSLTMNSEYG